MKPLLKVAFTLIAAVALPSAFATPDPVGAAPEKPAQAETKPLPAPADVLERYAKAIGGKEAFKKHSSQHATGTVQIPAQGINGKMEIFAARPNKLIMKSTVPGVGELNTGFNGKVGWMSTALTGPMLLQGKMLDQVATQADFDQSLHDPADYKTIQILGLEQFNGEDCYKLRLIHRTGFDSTEYFSAETGLQRGFITTQESPLGPVTTTTTVTDYKQFGDLFMPSRISQKAAGIETVMTIAEMEYDHVDPSVFDLPPDVKVLVEKPADKSQGPLSASQKKIEK